MYTVTFSNEELEEMKAKTTRLLSLAAMMTTGTASTDQ